MIKTTGSILVLLMVAIAYTVARSNPVVFEKETVAVGEIWKDCGKLSIANGRPYMQLASVQLISILLLLAIIEFFNIYR